MAGTTLTSPTTRETIGPAEEAPITPPAPPAPLPRRLFTADEFKRMAEAGVFLQDERLELIGGRSSS
jgi:hypothetical protein